MALAQRETRDGREPTLKGTRNQVRRWLAARHMGRLFKVAVEERDEDGLPRVTYRFQQRAWRKPREELLCKTLVFTDNDNWSDTDLVRGHRAQDHFESALRQFKDTDCIAISDGEGWSGPSRPCCGSWRGSERWRSCARRPRRAASRRFGPRSPR